MKKPLGSKKPSRRQIFVLTAEEKRTIAFVLLAFMLGLGTKCYRDRHPDPDPTPAKVPHKRR